MSIRKRAKELVEAIEDNYQSCREAGIDDTGAFIKQMHIADEMEELKKELAKKKSGKVA